jgi:hypothetical protein
MFVSTACRVPSRVLFVVFLMSCFAIVGGCGVALNPDGSPGGGSASPINPSTSDLTIIEEDTNDAFESAQRLSVAGQVPTVDGEITDEEDIDVFDIGAVFVGDRLMAEVFPETGLNSVIALFDESGTCLLVNDHRNVYLGSREPFIDVTIREPSEHCYLAVTTTPYYESVGAYQMIASLQVEQPLPEPRPDVVLLDFRGASNVTVGDRAATDVPPFDAGNIDPVYENDTDEMIATVVAKIREDFQGLDVTILSTSEGAFPSDGTTRVYFGTYDPDLLGLSEGIDEYNAQSGQQAIIFVDTFSAFMPLDPTVEEMSQALANVASHEIGHLLGLVHTSDPASIMDITASLNGLMYNQYFKRAPLHEEVFPIGYQDAAFQLLDTTGGDADVVFMNQKHQIDMRSGRPLHYVGPPARQQLPLSTCGLHRFHGEHDHAEHKHDHAEHDHE